MTEDTIRPQAKISQQGFADLTVDHIQLAAEEEMRWKRIIQNDLESMPLASVGFWSVISVGVSSTLTQTLLLVYTIARVGHTIVYSQSLPRARMVLWIVGVAWRRG